MGTSSAPQPRVSKAAPNTNHIPFQLGKCLPGTSQASRSFQHSTLAALQTPAQPCPFSMGPIQILHIPPPPRRGRSGATWSGEKSSGASLMLLPQPCPTWGALWHCRIPGTVAATAQGDAALTAFENKSLSARHLQPVSVLITLLHLPRVQGLSVWDVWVWARNSWETPNISNGETAAKPKFLVGTRMDVW